MTNDAFLGDLYDRASPNKCNLDAEEFGHTVYVKKPNEREFAIFAARTLGECLAYIKNKGSVPGCSYAVMLPDSSWYSEDIINPGYHITKIEKGVLGESSKILEEVQELQDAEKQGCKIMALVELSDLYGAINAYLRKHHPEVSFDDLKKMSDITERAFASGNRKPKD